MLTQEQVGLLNQPFAPEDHDWRNGFAYITEDAVVARLNQVDPSWQWVVVSITRIQDAAVCHGRLIVCDVTRDGIGMDKVNTANEAEKSAATDALKRAARLIGIGQYLLTKPKWVTDNAGIARWLAGEAPASQPSQSQPAPRMSAPTPSSAPSASGELYVDADDLTVKLTQKGDVFYVIGGVSIFRKAFDQLQSALQQPLPDEEGQYAMPKTLRIYYTQGEKYKDFIRLEVAGNAPAPSGPQGGAGDYLQMPASILRTADTVHSAHARKAIAHALADGKHDNESQRVIMQSLGITQWSDYKGTVAQLLSLINPSDTDMPF